MATARKKKYGSYGASPDERKRASVVGHCRSLMNHTLGPIVYRERAKRHATALLCTLTLPSSRQLSIKNLYPIRRDRVVKPFSRTRARSTRKTNPAVTPISQKSQEPVLTCRETHPINEARGSQAQKLRNHAWSSAAIHSQGPIVYKETAESQETASDQKRPGRDLPEKDLKSQNVSLPIITQSTRQARLIHQCKCCRKDLLGRHDYIMRSML